MKSYLDWPLLKMVWKFWNGLQNEYVYNLSLWILITQCNYTYLYVYIQTFHACPSIHILQCKLPFLWNLQNPITLKWILWGLSVLIQIAFSCLYTKFEPILFFKIGGWGSLKFGPIGAGSLGWGRLAGFLSGVSTFFAI